MLAWSGHAVPPRLAGAPWYPHQAISKPPGSIHANEPVISSQAVDRSGVYAIIQDMKLPKRHVADLAMIPIVSDFFEFPGVTLEPIVAANIPETVDLINEAYSYQDAVKGAPRTNPKHLADRIAQSDFCIAKVGSAIVGCVYLDHDSKGSLHMGLLTVQKSYQHKGLGSAIVRAVESFAGASKIPEVILDYMSVAPWLKTYYERRGYHETGLVQPWGTIDLVRMSKKLS